MTPPRFRFRFYGVRPRDWREGAASAMRYELALVSAPTAASRAAIVAAFEAAIVSTPVTSAAAPWLWAGRWATFAVGVAVPPDGAAWELARRVMWDRFFNTIEEAMHVVADAAPIDQVVFVNAAAPSKGAAARWEQWSLAQAPATAAPAWATDGTVDEAAEAVRAAHLAATADATPWWDRMLETLTTLP
jgi:hypothetical protein